MKDKLPRRWEEKRLEEITSKPQYGYTASASFDNIGPKMLRITDITNGKIDWKKVPYCSCDEKELKKYQLKKDDLLFARTGSTGSSILIKDIPEPSVFASYLIRLKIKGKIEPDYLNHFFQSWYYWKQIESLKVGAVQSGINASVLSSLKVPVPSLVEQRGVVEVLGCVDECIRLTDEVIGSAEELKRGLMQRLLTQGIGHTEYKQTPLGRIPKTWKIVRIKDITRVTNGSTPKRTVPEYWEGGTIPWIKTTQVNDVYIKEAEEFITKKGYKNSSLTRLPKYTVLISMIGQGKNRGKSALLLIDNATTNQNFAAILPNNNFDSYFLHYFLEYNYRRIRALGQGSNQDALNCKIVQSIRILLPPLSEQKEIAQIIKSFEEKIQQDKTRREIFYDMKQGLMQSLLSGKVRVEWREDGLHRVGDSRETHN